MPRRYKRSHDRNLKRYYLECSHCKNSFSTTRPDARFCSPAHREAARRVRVVIAARKLAEEEAHKLAVAEAKRKSKRHKKPSGRASKRKTKDNKRGQKTTRE